MRNNPYLEIAKSTSKSVFEEYANKGYSRKEIANIFKISETSLGRIFSKLNIHTNGQNDEYYNKRAKFNIHKFDTIDSEEKSYWIGLLFADGCISKDQVILNLKDLDHVKKFKSFLEDTRDDEQVIKKYVVKRDGKEYISYTYRACNKYFVNTLINLGCVRKKSLILKFPNVNIFSEHKLIYDFIRGYVDGDGSLTTNGKRGRLQIIILGTLEFLSEVKKYLPQFPSIYKKGNIFKLGCSSDLADQIAYKLYENSTVSLNRKYERYATLCKLHNSETSDKIGESCDANAEVTPEIAKGPESTVENSE